MSEVIKLNLNKGNFDEVLQAIEQYQKELNSKIEDFVNALVSEGVTVASLCVASTNGDSKLPDVTYEINPNGDIVSAIVAIVGSDVLFVEFGSGIAYNTGAQHPKAGELGYGPGTYPNQTHVPIPGYWYYGKGKRSIGTEATMPIYNASETMRNEIIKKAIETFRS